MPRFNVTYDIVTPESAEFGDADERGFVVENATLSEAIDAVTSTRTSHVGGVECIEPNIWPWQNGSFDSVTVSNGMEYLTGACESRTLHIPENVTRSSRLRIARLIGVK